ncbi:hypothetical protein Q8W71_04735 [Methylobacterium sp. NEAU 140]|uniref:hypothetical protein n=1 Tax=Methylobacterium sp. NEAU 140 TaxID=3064945 RepID=UPI002732C985|nr:hypothetical protein [Methylobacterium sp. NEAU 140]MDP4021923.1 hypothetical protein [Methylobacterium sp. NEAU 140]
MVAQSACRVALINSIGNLGGFIGPYVVGWIRQETHSFEAGFPTSVVSRSSPRW